MKNGLTAAIIVTCFATTAFFASTGTAPAAGLIGTNFLIGGTASVVADEKPVIAFNSRRREYLVVWHNQASGTDSYVKARLLNSNGMPIGNLFFIEGATPITGKCKDTAVAYNPVLDEYFVAWTYLDGGIHSVRGKWISANGLSQGGSLVISDVSPGENAVFPSIAFSDISRVYLVSWTHALSGESFLGIRGQLLDHLAVRQGGNFGICPGSTEVQQLHPSVAYNRAMDEFAVAWETYNTNGVDQSVYVQRLATNGSPVGPTTLIYDTVPSRAPRIAALSEYSATGKYLIVWEYQYTEEIWDIWGRIMDGNGDLGDPIMIAYDYRKHEDPSVSANDETDSFMITWSNNGNILARHFPLRDGLRQEFVVATNSVYEPCVAAGNNKNFLIAFPRTEPSGCHIYGQLWGTPAGNPGANLLLLNER